MRRPLAVLLAVVVAGVLAPVAGAGTVHPPYARFSLHYTAHDPGSRTGIRYLAQQRTPPAGETAPPVRRLTVRLAGGTRFDTSAIRRCRATDAEITTKGVAACPRASRLG